jgi:hypothetical protein
MQDKPIRRPLSEDEIRRREAKWELKRSVDAVLGITDGAMLPEWQRVDYLCGVKSVRF